MNTKAWADLVRELEAGGAGPWTCPEQGDADITVVGIKDGCRVVEWHLHCPACGAETYVRRGLEQRRVT